MWLQPHDLTIGAAGEAEGGGSRARLCPTRVTTLLFLGIRGGRRHTPYSAEFCFVFCVTFVKFVTRRDTDRAHRGVIRLKCLLWWRIKNNCWPGGAC